MKKFNIRKSLRDSQKGAEGERREPTQSNQIPLRLNILFLFIFLAFVALIARLGYMQLMNSEFYAAQTSLTRNTTTRIPSLRGQMFDAQGKPIVTNVLKPSVVFTRDGNTSAEQMRQAAIRLVELVNITPENVTDRARRDFFLADPANYQMVYARLSDFDKLNEDGSQKPESEIYQAAVDNVTEEEIDFDPQTLAAAFVFNRMNGASAFETVMITSNDISTDDVATIGANEGQLFGISTGTDWSRKVDINNTISTLIGTVTTTQQGIPADPPERRDELLAKGYAPNDRVGVGQLEQQYETVLQGAPTITQLHVDNNGNILDETVQEQGRQGDSIKLTINMDFQNRVEQIIRDGFQNAMNANAATFSTGVDVVVMNPNTGAVLAVFGLTRDPETNQIWTDALQPINRLIVPGSTIKAATIAAGFEAGVITPQDNTIIDQPIVLQGGVTKTSIFNTDGSRNAALNVVSALYRSSNSYMMQLAIRMLGQTYSPNMVLNWSERVKVFEELRNAFGQFGLGVKTGIDLPTEGIGEIRKDFDNPEIMGLLLDLSFGQFDTYTTLQLASYASTVATGGTRVAPHLVQGIFETTANGGLGELIKSIGSNVVDNIPISADAMSLIQQGFYQVVHGNVNDGATGTTLRNSRMDMAAKTGTAEHPVFINGQLHNLVNSNVAAYAPYNNPTVAIGLTFRDLNWEEGHFATYHMQMVNQIMDAYYDMFASKGITP